MLFRFPESKSAAARSFGGEEARVGRGKEKKKTSDRSVEEKKETRAGLCGL